MAPRLGDQREQLLPAITAIDAAARYCFEKGLYRLASIFGDRAADIAFSGGPALRKTWFTVERRAADYQMVNGHYLAAFDRCDFLLAETGKILDERHSYVLTSRHLRAEILDRLGRHDEALSEINQLIPIYIEVLGERHPDGLASRYLRARVLESIGRSDVALSEIDQLIPVHTEVLGKRHHDSLASRFLRATILGNLHRYGEALSEINQLIPAEIETLGEDHPDVLVSKCVKAELLWRLGRNDEARAELDALESRLTDQTDADGDRRRRVQTIRAALDSRSLPPAVAAE